MDCPGKGGNYNVRQNIHTKKHAVNDVQRTEPGHLVARVNLFMHQAVPALMAHASNGGLMGMRRPPFLFVLDCRDEELRGRVYILAL